VLHYT